MNFNKYLSKKIEDPDMRNSSKFEKKLISTPVHSFNYSLMELLANISLI
jgi:hypothetical protein